MKTIEFIRVANGFTVNISLSNVPNARILYQELEQIGINFTSANREGERIRFNIQDSDHHFSATQLHDRLSRYSNGFENNQENSRLFLSIIESRALITSNELLQPAIQNLAQVSDSTSVQYVRPLLQHLLTENRPERLSIRQQVEAILASSLPSERSLDTLMRQITAQRSQTTINAYRANLESLRASAGKTEVEVNATKLQNSGFSEENLSAEEKEKYNDKYCCPLSLLVMDDPVYFKTDVEGENGKQRFERRFITKWLTEGAGTHPITRKKALVSDLESDAELKSEIEAFVENTVSPKNRMT